MKKGRELRIRREDEGYSIIGDNSITIAAKSTWDETVVYVKAYLEP